MLVCNENLGHIGTGEDIVKAAQQALIVGAGLALGAALMGIGTPAQSQSSAPGVWSMRAPMPQMSMPRFERRGRPSTKAPGRTLPALNA